MDNTNNTNNPHNANKGVSVRVLDKEFVIACPKSAENALRASASYLDEQMRKIRKTGRVVGIERIAVMAALNISHELLTIQSAPKTEMVDGLQERLNALSQKIDHALLDTMTETQKIPELETEV